MYIRESSINIYQIMFQLFIYLSFLCRETRRLLERLVYASSEDIPVTVVQVASWYLHRHLHAKNDQELLNVSVLPTEWDSVNIIYQFPILSCGNG